MSATKTSPEIWTKEACIELAKDCKTKKEFQEKHEEAFNAIEENEWKGVFAINNLGKNLKQQKNTTATKGTSPSKPKTVAKTYKLKTYQPLSFTLNVGRNKKLIVWDEESQTSRAIRHCPNERTIYLDGQNKDTAVVEPIVFIKGFYETTEKEEYTQKFLEASPKFNVLFELVNAEVNASKLINREDIIIDIKQAIRDKAQTEVGIEEIRAIVSVLNSDPAGAAKMTPSELRYAAYTAVDTNPNRFIDEDQNITVFDDSQIKRTAIAQHAFLSGIIKPSADGRKVMWSDNNATICNIPPGLGYMEIFSDFLATEEGVTVARELTKR